MRTDIWYDSGSGKCRIHGCRWTPEGDVKAVVQIVHGIAEFVERYDDFANFLASRGILVVAEDHMGHGQSINGEGIRGYFHGGWDQAVADTYQLLSNTRREFPGVPYILFGHSMGSFMARTILCRHPDSGIAGAVICGTGWQPTAAMPVIVKLMEAVCKKTGEQNPSDKMHSLIFGGYNAKVEHPRTKNDWLTRDDSIVDAYENHPLCGFVPSVGLLRDMMQGIFYIQQSKNLAKMHKDLPVWFIAGGDDPVGSYGKGVTQAAEAFRKAGMTDVSVKIYPLCRHEILNEINKDEVYADVAEWIEKTI